MIRRLLLSCLLPLLSLGACATVDPGGAAQPGAAPSNQALLDRLPPEINGFALVAADSLPPPPAGMVQRPYRGGGAEGPLARVTAQPVAADSGAAPPADGIWGAVVQQRLLAEAAGAFATAGLMPETRAERGPDFLIRRRGGPPLLRCVDIRLLRRDGVLRNLTCASLVEGQLVRVQMITGHRPDQTDVVTQLLTAFGGSVMESLGVAAGTPSASGPSPEGMPLLGKAPAGAEPEAAPAERPLSPELLRRLPRA